MKLILALLLFFSPLAFSYTGLGQESVSKETIKKFAAPAIENTLNNKIQQMLDVRSPGMGMLSPDGKSLYFTWAITGVRQIWKMTGPKSFPIQLTGGSAPAGIADITPDGKTLIVSRDFNGEENPGIYKLDSSGGELIPIQKMKGVQTIYSYMSTNGEFIYFKSNDKKADQYTFYKYNLKTNTREEFFDEPGYWYISDVLKDRYFLMTKAMSNVASENFVLDTVTKKLTPVIGQNESEDYSIHFGRNEKEFFVLTNKLRNFKTLYTYKNGTLKAIEPLQENEISHFSVSKNREILTFGTNEKGYSKLHALNTKTLKPIKLPAFQGDHVYAGQITKDSRYMSIGIDAYNKTRESFIYDFKTKKLTAWTIASSPEVKVSEFLPQNLEYYPSRDGVQIPMFVTRPKSCINKSCPVIVDFHGGPESQSTPGLNIRGQLFAEEGFIYVEPNVRGSDGYGKIWINLDNGPKRWDVITDIEDCAKFIKSNWNYEGKVPKIGVMGTSYGGYSTLFAMTYFAGAYDAGAANVGMSNLVTFLQNTAPYRRSLRAAEYGDLEKDKDSLIKLSPTTYVDRMKSPLLIIQGVNDPRVPVGEALLMHSTLEKKGIPSSLILFADEGHGTSKKENIALEIGNTLAFFKKHLL